MKVLIFGLPGAGKTTFANRLGAAKGIDVFHIDPRSTLGLPAFRFTRG